MDRNRLLGRKWKGDTFAARRLDSRGLSFEPLETRNLLSGLVSVGAQPSGALSGKIVYAHGGHGWTADNLGSGAWSTQRPWLFDMVEDLGNQDQLTFFADYLFNAGATVVPLRPIGHQPNEVVLDNDDVGVTFEGAWSDSAATTYFGSAGDTPYRFAQTSPNETAVATYTPDLPAAGFYPVYAWATSGANRTSSQIYRVNHSGGATEVTVNHRRVGNGLIYLGTYHFESGREGNVEISNRSDDAGVVVADMIRFGNGVGDIDRGGGVSGVPREDESGLYWVKWHVDRSQGISDLTYRASTSDRSASVSFSPRYAAYMNRADDGSLSDRVFVSFHSNAASGSSRGVLGLVNGNSRPDTATPNQQLLAARLAGEINSDLALQNGQFEHNWAFRTSLTLDRSDIEFGEINNTYINNEFDATIIETGFHDNELDAEMLRDPRVREALARATYQGLVRYFDGVDGGSTSLRFAPAVVSDVRAHVVAEGQAEISWSLPAVNAYAGGVPQGYFVYTSRNGYGFDGGTYVDGASTTSHTFTDLETGSAPYYFKVVAANEGGQGPASEVVGVLPNVPNALSLPGEGPTSAATRKLLIVNGFDRMDRTLSPVEPFQNQTVQRVRQRFTNSRDYVVQHLNAIAASDRDLQVDSTANENVLSTVDLSDYEMVIWVLGEESTADDTFSAAEQTAVFSYLSGGGKLFLSGGEIGWDLDQRGNGRAFYEETLRADYVRDDAGTYRAQGVDGSIFAGIDLTFDDGTLFYDVTFPDVIQPQNGSQSALAYVGGTGGTAAIQYASEGTGRLVMMGFPFETVVDVANRNVLMGRVLDFFGLSILAAGDLDGDGTLACTDLEVLANGVRDGATASRMDLNEDGVVDVSDVRFWIEELKQAPLGDANLDSFVDEADFALWNANRFVVASDWCHGDFNFDGITDVSDYNLWHANRDVAQATSAQPASGRPPVADSTASASGSQILWAEFGIEPDLPFVGPLQFPELQVSESEPANQVRPANQVDFVFAQVDDEEEE